ncbi:MAG TPA: methionine--tRNA ligase [Elusimicrobia bacterium]|nr:methionine--tRNA ligase [Elusimicrobiota bacterium]
MKKYYITTPIYYVNDTPHIGHAYTTVAADVLSRYHRLRGEDVYFLTGTDEHGSKIEQAAQKAGTSPKEFADHISSEFRKAWEELGISFSGFIRTTDPKHESAVKSFLQKLFDKGLIYKGNYSGLYCVGCEQFYKKGELVDGKCPEHLIKPEVVEEENYFFKLSRYQKRLEKLIADGKLRVLPEVRKNETLGFIRQGLEDFSVSRPKERLSDWGIPVPGDDSQVMYVWFDALTIYMTAVGWNWDLKKFKTWWPADLHVIGKGIYRFHTVYWPAMLLSTGFPLPKAVLVHGYVTSDGQKMAKSLGNVVDPEKLLAKYGTDPVRYYLLKEIPTQSDGDFTEARFKEVYNADLANGLGNLVARVLTMADKFTGGKVPSVDQDPDAHPLRVDEKIYNWKKAWQAIDQHVNAYEFQRALEAIWEFVHAADKYIDENKPWELAKKGQQKEIDWVVYGLLDSLHQLAWQIYPFLPGTAQKVAHALSIEKLLAKNPIFKDSWVNIKPGTKIKKIKPLFPRL